MKNGLRVATGVTAAWLAAGVLWGAQTALGSAVSGGAPLSLRSAIPSALGQTLPWIPVTLAAVALAIRFPLTRGQWRRHALVHVAGAIVLAFTANVLVVLQYWATTRTFGGFAMLVRMGMIWATVRLHIALVIYIAIVAITQTVRHYRRARSTELQMARLEGQLARARLQALTAQIRPHFLFNTLHTIGQLWRSGQSDDADAVLDHLGSLFHKVQHSTSRLEVPLAEELDLVRDYLAIETMRFRDRLKPTVSSTPDALMAMVPPLILQPLVENAVRHGISALSSAGVVDVCAERIDGTLRLTVRDDGPGIGRTASAPGSGTGLRNTRERLEQLYGVSAVLRIDSSHGTCITIELPYSASGHLYAEGAGAG